MYGHEHATVSMDVDDFSPDSRWGGDICELWWLEPHPSLSQIDTKIPPPQQSLVVCRIQAIFVCAKAPATAPTSLHDVASTYNKRTAIATPHQIILDNTPIRKKHKAIATPHHSILNKTATRQNHTACVLQPLREWLAIHRTWPFPTRLQKSNLMQVSGLTFAQVSQWFSNTRKRKLVDVEYLF